MLLNPVPKITPNSTVWNASSSKLFGQTRDMKPVDGYLLTDTLCLKYGSLGEGIIFPFLLQAQCLQILRT